MGGPFFFPMSSQLDQFITGATFEADPIMGTDSLVIDLGAGASMTLVGVWSGVSGSNEGEDGGMMPDVDASICVPAAAAVNRALVGRVAAAKGEGFRISNVDVGEALTTIYLINEMKIL